MSEVEESEARIRDLPTQDFASLREWFHEFENERWDAQIAADFRGGKSKRLIDNSKAEFAPGKAREL